MAGQPRLPGHLQPVLLQVSLCVGQIHRVRDGMFEMWRAFYIINPIAHIRGERSHQHFLYSCAPIWEAGRRLFGMVF